MYTFYMEQKRDGNPLPAGSALLHLATEIPAEHAPGFDRWCEGHVRSNLELPGFLAARRFVRNDDWPGAGSAATYLTLYDLEDTSALSSDAYAAHDQSVPDAYARQLRFVRSVYREIGERPEPDTQQTGRAILHVTVDVDPDYTEPFLAWYANEHVPAVLEAPGMIAARRFENVLARDSAPLPDGQHTYCTLYEMEEADVISRPETLQASARGACPPSLEPHRVAANRVYEEFFRGARVS